MRFEDQTVSFGDLDPGDVVVFEEDQLLRPFSHSIVIYNGPAIFDNEFSQICNELRVSRPYVYVHGENHLASPLISFETYSFQYDKRANNQKRAFRIGHQDIVK